MAFNSSIRYINCCSPPRHSADVDVGTETAGQAGPEEGQVGDAVEAEECTEGDAERTREKLPTADACVLFRELFVSNDLDRLHGWRVGSRLVLDNVVRRLGFFGGGANGDGHQLGLVGLAGLPLDAGAPFVTGVGRPTEHDHECTDDTGQSGTGDGEDEEL